MHPLSLNRELIRRMEFLKKVRIELAIFFVLFFTYSYFHQGGGWNQNSRFDQIRSIVERGEFEINNYMVYRAAPDSGPSSLRRFALAADVHSAQIEVISNTADVSLFQGRVYPNKPPGTALIAVPAYFAIYRLERLLGIDRDDWWILTVNAYLTTIFSVGLPTALGAIAFYRISLRLFPSAAVRTHVASTMTFGLGTMLLPFATMLFDHGQVAALSLATFWLLLLSKDRDIASSSFALVLLVAGLLAGLSVMLNYSSIIFLVLFALYATWIGETQWKTLFFAAGAMLPLLFLAWYHQACFGSVLATANAYQLELFRGEGMSLFGMFRAPQFDVMIKLLFSGYRGLFVTSPVLMLSVFGFWLMWVRNERRAEMGLVAAIFLGFLLMNSSFYRWNSGWTIGPRYIIPALPFLSLLLALVFEKLPRTTSAIAGISATVMLLVTAVDPQPFTGFQNPLRDYILPLLRGETVLLKNIPIQGPVSANPIGVYESWFRSAFYPGTVQRQWNSFNLGEFLWPGSFASLLPLFCVLVVGLGILWHWSRVPSRIIREP